MKILVVYGDCILSNSSCNLCHLAYIRGLINEEHEITLLSKDEIRNTVDPSLSVPKEVKNVTFSGFSLYEKLAIKKIDKRETFEVTSASNDRIKYSLKEKIVYWVKRIVHLYYGPHWVYGKFAKVAKKYKATEEFDIVISLSTPPSSHLLAYNLIKSKHIQTKKWIQIWEDPWYLDICLEKDEHVRKEEARLLRVAEKVCYVSPITLMYQKKQFSESANKMFWQPLPAYYESSKSNDYSFKHNSYGYFGDYVPSTRNLQPFYEAAKALEIEVNICGNPEGLFESTDRIHIHPRLPLSELHPIENRTNVLVFLCNLHGGQIPGKIYQYSATDKMILFILDGTKEEEEVLRSYFQQFNRYLFCENNVEDIKTAIKKIESGQIDGIVNESLDNFKPERIVHDILAM